MMLPIKNEAIFPNSRTNSSINIWFYLSIEFIIGILISGCISILNIIKLLLPKPPRNLAGDVVLIAGISSKLGESIAEKFMKKGCSVICVDNDLRYIEKTISTLKLRCCKVEEIRPNYRKHELENKKPIMMSYECNLLDRNAICKIAKQIEDKVGGIDVLVTCVGQDNQDISDMANTTPKNHYWMMLAFLPSLLRRDRAYIVNVTPVASSQDMYLLRAANAGMMEILGRKSQELSDHSCHFTFLSPVIKRGYTRQKEQQVAEEIVEAVSRDQNVIGISWYSEILYKISSMIYSTIMTLTQWLHTQGSDYSF